MKYLRTLIVGVVGGVIGAALLWVFQGNSLRLVPGSMSYSELTAVMLAAVSVMVTILGVVVAIITIWGYAHFRSIAESAAKTHVTNELENGSLRQHIENSVTEFMQREFSESGKLRNLLEERVDNILVAGPSERETESKAEEDDDEANV